MLFEAFRWRLTTHTDIKAFEYAIELRVGSTKSGILCKHPLGEFNNIHLILHA